MLRIFVFTAFTSLILALAPSLALAEQPVAVPPPEKVTELIRIMEDPAVAAWMKDHQTTETTPSTTVVLSGILEWEARARSDFRRLLGALPTLPAEIAAAMGRVRDEASSKGFMPVAVILVAVLLLSHFGEWVARGFLHRAWREHPLIKRTVIELLPVFAFVLIAGLLYFMMDWPPLLGAVVFFYLLAAVVFRLVWAVCAMARVAGTLSTFMFRRILLFSGILLFALATNAAGRPLAVNTDASRNAAMLFSLALLAISLNMVWRHSPTPGIATFRIKTLQSGYLLLLWVLWSVGLHVAFWIGVYLIAFPMFLPFVDQLTKAYAATRWPDDPNSSVPTVLVVRGVRALIIGAAVLWLTAVWQYNPASLGRVHSLLNALILGVFRSVIVLLVADLGWSVAKAMINRKLASVAGDAVLSPEEAARRARLRTLLPILRNGLAALVVVMTTLTVLAELGVQIGPLIAGAGIFGVAIGFGSQTLVKDVISGIFYLMDDAFRVGEYIQSGSYMGTVESFSLRSVRLRHHRGPIFTVPFGELGAVQNMSRDWAIDKFMLRLNFDADIPKAKKLVKAIGAELLEDPEYGPLIIETLKLKGVEQIGDFGIEVSFTFTAVPGHQSMIRRSAYSMIRKAFQENDIGFSQPTVQVGGDSKSDAAAAAITLARQRAAQAAADGGSET